MATQKQQINDLRDYAANLGAIVSIRKNSYAEYDTRIRMNGDREYVLTYLADSFEDAIGTARYELDGICNDQRAEGERRQQEYSKALDEALTLAQSILNLVGCRIDVDAQDTVTMHSPITGTHSLCMKLGVRPVSDLLHHVCGFAEQQTHSKQFADALSR